MKNYLIANRYARGLDRALPEEANRDEAAASLRELGKLYAAQHDLRSVLSNPAIPADQRAAVLESVLEREGAPRHVRELLHTMLRRGRISILPDVAELYSALADAHLGRAGAAITTASELSPDQAEQLRLALERFTGKSVRADFSVNPRLLGGVVTRIEGKIIDGSLRARIRRLKQSLLPEENLGG